MRTSLLTRNPGLKALAFVIAVALWILVSGEEESVRVYNVPLDFTNAGDRMLAGDTPGTVQVRIRGSESVLRSLAEDDLRIPIDLSSAPAPRRMIQRLDPGSVQGVPSGAAVESVSPDHLTLAIERKVSRVIRVSARLEGSPAPGYRTTEIDLNPDQVTVEGPESEVSRLSLVLTKPVPIQGKQQTFTALAGTSIENSRVHVLETRLIRVTVRIEKEEEKK